MPVLMVATYNEDGSVNVMNAAWGTMQERGNVALNLTETHKTVKNIKARGAFTVSIADAAHVAEADYFGVESGNKNADKFENSGLTAIKAETVDAPVINEFPLCLECEFIEYQDNPYGCGVIGRVINATADESVMSGDKIDISLVNAIAFDPYTWLLQGNGTGWRSLQGWPETEKMIFAERGLHIKWKALFFSINVSSKPCLVLQKPSYSSL